eukprot:5473512-Karenia_brevis.AAC.1
MQLLADVSFVPRLPYNLQNDGDIWQLIHEALVQRGPRSVAISKVKGHATWSDCKSELQRCHKRNNDKADNLAKDAHELCHGIHTVRLCKFYETRFE